MAPPDLPGRDHLDRRPPSGSVGDREAGIRRPEEADRTQILLVQLPARRLEQLRLLADGQRTLAHALVSDWILERLDQQDPMGALLPIPARMSPSGIRLASVSRLPSLSAFESTTPDREPAPVVAWRPAATRRPDRRHRLPS